MITRFIGVKELRQNMAKISNRALKKKERLIILRKNKPIFELKPLSDSEVFAESFYLDIVQARQDVQKRRLHDQEEVEKMFGL